MPYRVYITEPPTLLEDLLEDSARLYHNRCAVTHRVFHVEWLKQLAEAVAREQAKRPGDQTAEVERRARRRLAYVRQALREGRKVLLGELERERSARDQAIRAFVSTHPQRPACAAA
ncbi:MAG: hypothetical protein U0797_14340 [Gemmataceae bacterium]